MELFSWLRSCSASSWTLRRSWRNRRKGGGLHPLHMHFQIAQNVRGFSLLDKDPANTSAQEERQSQCSFQSSTSRILLTDQMSIVFL